MIKTIRFTETQKFKQWWIWLLLIAFSAGSLFTLYYQIAFEKPVGDNPMSDVGLLFVTILMILLNVLFYSFKLETRIDEEGIHVRFFPFHLKFRSYRWSDMTGCYVRQYSPIGEYGGWGIKGWKSDRAFNVSGNLGIQITFSDGRKLLIGTNSPKLAEEVIKELQPKE